MSHLSRGQQLTEHEGSHKLSHTVDRGGYQCCVERGQAVTKQGMWVQERGMQRRADGWVETEVLGGLVMVGFWKLLTLKEMKVCRLNRAGSEVTTV